MNSRCFSLLQGKTAVAVDASTALATPSCVLPIHTYTTSVVYHITVEEGMGRLAEF